MVSKKMPHREKMMKDRPPLTSLIGELTYDLAGAEALRRNGETDDRYIDVPLNELPFPLNPLSLVPDIEVKKGKVTYVWPSSPITALDTVKRDYELGEITRENAFWRVFLDTFPLTVSNARKRQLIQELQARYARYAWDENVSVKSVDREGNFLLLRMDNGDTVPVPATREALRTLEREGPRALLRSFSEKKVEKIERDVAEVFKESLGEPFAAEKYWWLATAPFETRLVDGKLRVEVDEKAPRREPRNVNAAYFFGGVVENLSKDREVLEGMKRHGVKDAYVYDFRVAGDTAARNQEWVRGLDVEPNVAPHFNNVPIERVAQIGGGAATVAAGVASALSGNWLLGLALAGIGVLIFLYLSLSGENRKEVVRWRRRRGTKART